MITNRRSFFASLVAAPAAVALARPLLAAPAVEVLPAVAPPPIPAPEPPQESAAETVLRFVADALHDRLMAQLVLGRLATRDFEPLVMRVGDTVNFPLPPKLIASNYTEGSPVHIQHPTLGNVAVNLAANWRANFCIPDMERAIRYPEILDIYVSPPAIALSQNLDQMLCTAVNNRECDCFTAHGKRNVYAGYSKAILVTRRLPAVMPGTGALSRYVERDCVGVRVIMSYCPKTLAQVFSVDVMAGVGVLA